MSVSRASVHRPASTTAERPRAFRDARPLRGALWMVLGIDPLLWLAAMTYAEWASRRQGYTSAIDWTAVLRSAGRYALELAPWALLFSLLHTAAIAVMAARLPAARVRPASAAVALAGVPLALLAPGLRDGVAAWIVPVALALFAYGWLLAPRKEAALSRSERRRAAARERA
jgi:hypothetical protein